MDVEGFELVPYRLGGVDLLDGPVDLKPVVVHDETKVVKAMVAGKHRGLPDLPLLELTVTKQGIDAVAVTPQLSGERHAHGHRDPLAQGAGAHVNPGGIPHVGMSLELRP